ncbi:hypothetical protein [Arenibacter echinorum]|uniref:Uncharacterized protein n=1 Tax=Arenibacter echinorum TaxID=440515 RepID=A0A327R1L0_9FLAO|nr:hypothetical protein [Arenibacter echinorum]RAJ10135.1 hypothetical protein LV92_02881 [Arenibacter echinorum]
MKYFTFFCAVWFLMGSSLNAQQSPIPSLDNDALVTDWSEHEANAFKRKGKGSTDSLVFDFNYKDRLSSLMDNHKSNNISSKKKTVEMPIVKPSGSYPMTIYCIDSSNTYAARIYKY